MKIPVTDLINLIHECPHAILATHSMQMPGFPFATAVPLFVDEGQHPVLLISALAEHTKNLLSDPRSSLALVENGPQNVQNARRATLVGNFVPCEASQALINRYLSYQPDAEQYLQLDFIFFRMEILRVRYIGGIGKMGWLEMSDMENSSAITLDEESRLLTIANRSIPAHIRLLGIDACGIDYLADGLRQRLCFEHNLNFGSLETTLPELLKQLKK